MTYLGERTVEGHFFDSEIISKYPTAGHSLKGLWLSDVIPSEISAQTPQSAESKI